MNLKKYTKAELISKINGLKQNNNNPTFFSKTLGFILLFKSFILKFTLIAIIVKIFKKYSIIRKFWSLITSILFSIFGISLIDIYEIDMLSKFIHQILDLFSNFHLNILKLFGEKVESPSKIETLRSIQQTTTGVQTSNDESNRIIERFKQIVNKKEEIVTDILTEEEIPLYRNKYIIIAGILILSGLGYYFWDDVGQIPSTIVAKLLSFRRGPGSDPTNPGDGFATPSSEINTENVQTRWNITRNIKRRWSEWRLGKDESYWTTPSESPVSLVNELPNLNKGKQIDPTELSNAETNKRLLSEISGNTQLKFDQESATLLQNITNFIDRAESFPNIELQEITYNAIRGRLLSLSALAPTLYESLIQDDKIYNEIEKFVALEKEIITSDNHSNTYDEIAKATIEEQDVWSDRANTPSPKSQLLSPIYENLEPVKLIDSDINKNIDELDTLHLKFHIPEFNDDPLDQYYPETEPKTEIKKPEISIKDNSDSNSSLDHYFPKSELKPVDIKIEEPTKGEELKTEVKPQENTGIKGLLAQIQARRNDKDVIATPNIANIGLNTPIQERLKASPLTHKESFTNLFENTTNLFYDQEPLDETIDNLETKLESTDLNQEVETNNFIEGSSNDNIVTKASFTNLFSAIKSQRKEYGTPEDKTINLQNSDNDDTDESISSTDIQPQWEKIKPILSTTDPLNRFVTIDFQDLKNKVNKILVMTNDGRSQYFTPHFSKNSSTLEIKWDNLGISNPDHKELEITNIFIMEKDSSRSNWIYKNLKARILPSFHENKQIELRKSTSS